MKITSICVFITLSTIVSISSETPQQWSPEDLIDYSIETYGKSPEYFLSDPHKYISDKQRFVINYRLKDIFKKFNINTYFFLINDIKDVTTQPDVNEDDDESDDEDEFDGELNSTQTQPKKKNMTLALKRYSLSVHKLLSSKSIGNYTLTMIIIYTMNDNVGTYIRVGDNILPILLKDSIQQLLTNKDNLIAKGKVYQAVDDLLSGFIYLHRRRGTTEKLFGYLNDWSEFIMIAVVMAVSLGIYGKNTNNNEETNANTDTDTNTTPSKTSKEKKNN
jgi:hypothetical protein